MMRRALRWWLRRLRAELFMTYDPFQCDVCGAHLRSAAEREQHERGCLFD